MRFKLYWEMKNAQQHQDQRNVLEYGFYFCVCVWLGFVGVLFGWFGFVGESWRGREDFLILILFLKCAVHISAKTDAHISEAAWVL